MTGSCETREEQIPTETPKEYPASLVHPVGQDHHDPETDSRANQEREYIGLNIERKREDDQAK